MGPQLSATTAASNAGGTLWTIADQLGSIRDLVDNNGITREHVVYDSFGNRVEETNRNASNIVVTETDPSAVDTIFRYTGRE